jgi:hypothetical protein
MKRVMVRYRVRADRVEENERYIGKVFEQLDRERPAGLRYASFKLEDGVSFIHIVSVDAADGVSPLGALPAFKAFTASIEERCDELPVVAQLSEVGSYQFFGAPHALP